MQFDCMKGLVPLFNNICRDNEVLYLKTQATESYLPALVRTLEILQSILRIN